MDKLTIYRYATFALLAINLGLLVFFVVLPRLGAESGPRPHTILALDEGQQEAFKSAAVEHRRANRALVRQQRTLITDYFAPLAEGGARPDSLSAEYFALELQKLNATYDHFAELRAELRAEQLERFPAFLDQVLAGVLVGGRDREGRRSGRPDSRNERGR